MLMLSCCLACFINLECPDLIHENSVQPGLRGHPWKENFVFVSAVHPHDLPVWHFFMLITHLEDYSGSIEFDYTPTGGQVYGYKHLREQFLPHPELKPKQLSYLLSLCSSVDFFFSFSSTLSLDCGPLRFPVLLVPAPPWIPFPTPNEASPSISKHPLKDKPFGYQD